MKHRREQRDRAAARARARLRWLMAGSAERFGERLRNCGRRELHRDQKSCRLVAALDHVTPDQIGPAAVGKWAATPTPCSCWKPGREYRHGNPRCRARVPAEPTRAGACVPPARLPTVRPQWRTETVRALGAFIARTGRAEAFGVLADALQDAGCDDAPLLDHCRRPRAHHDADCWVLHALGAARPPHLRRRASGPDTHTVAAPDPAVPSDP